MGGKGRKVLAPLAKKSVGFDVSVTAVSASRRPKFAGLEQSPVLRGH